MEIAPTKYQLKTISTGRCFQDTGWSLSDSQSEQPSLIRTLYDSLQINIKEEEYGIYKFADWLPVKRMLKGSYAPLTYKSEGLAKQLNLKELYITFSGYWPERGISMETCSFKETEAFSVCARLPKDFHKILVVASAGNTARAFARVCSENNIPIVISIPRENMDAIWFKKPLNDCVKIICSPIDSDYYDAIELGNKLCKSDDFLEEGGAKNVARRDGMGTTVLSATSFIGRIPDHYLQAIGSGTGTIAAYEANLRLIQDGRFGNNLMQLVPSQNYPFIPMYDAWNAHSRALLPFNQDEERHKALQIKAKVLSNRKPPYSIAGGLFDCLEATNGSMEIATNEELTKACEMFKELEGIDIYSAAGVAVSSLMKSVEKGIVKNNDVIMLNITGGGEKRFKNEHKVIFKEPDLVLDNNLPADEIINRVKALF